MLADGMIAAVLMSGTAYARILLASNRLLMPAGDTFNFISAAKNLAMLTYAPDERRLPLYSFFILIGSFFSDPIVVAIAISVIASVLTVGLLYLLGRKLGIDRFILGPVLVLAIVHPNLSLMGIRPLADSLFVMLVVLSFYLFVIAQPTVKWSIALGVMSAAMLLTRYEGYFILPVLALGLLVRWRLTWKLYAVIIATTGIVLLPWVMIAVPTYHGGWWKPYTKDLSNPDLGWSADSPTQFFGQVQTILEVTHWDNAWRIPAFLVEQQEEGSLEDSVMHALVTTPAWWFALSAALGVCWMLVNRPKYFLPLGGSFIVYSAVLAWWGPTFRFSSPLVVGWILSAAAGGMVVWQFSWRTYWMQRIVRGALVTFVAAGVISLGGVYAQQAWGQAMSGNGRSYTLVQVIRQLVEEQGNVAFDREVLMGSSYLGLIGSSSHPPQRSVALFPRYADSSLEELHAILKEQRIRWLVDRSDEHMVQLVDYLKSKGDIVASREYRWVTDNEEVPIDMTTVHELRL